MERDIALALSNEALTNELMRLAGSERSATVLLIAHLAEFDTRQLHLAAGHPSLFTYCTKVLRLSEDAAYSRSQAAVMSKSFPRILDMLRDGRLTLTTVRLLSTRLTNENQQELLDEASGLSKRDVEELLARWFPAPDIPASVRKLPAPKPPSCAAAPAAPCAATPAAPCAAATPAAPFSPTVSTAPPRRDLAAPLAPDRYHISFTASRSTRDKLQRARDLLRHAIPAGDTAEIIDRALTLLLADLTRKKFAATKRAGLAGGTAAGSRHIPAEVMRAVSLRDGERCAFVAQSGYRCTATAFLEFHHVVPYAVGGPATIANVEFRCKPHNRYEAGLYYGPRAPEGVVREEVLPYGLRARRNSTRSGTCCVALKVWPAQALRGFR